MNTPMSASRLARLWALVLLGIVLPGLAACGGGASDSGPASFAATFGRESARVHQTTPFTVSKVSATVATCCDGQTIHVAWSDRRFIGGSILYNRSDDLGATWLPQDVRLDAATGDSLGGAGPVICCDGADIYVVWLDDSTLLAARSADGGATWAAAATVSAVNRRSSVNYLAAACCAGTAFVAWTDDAAADSRDIDAFVARSTDGGASWSQPTTLDSRTEDARELVLCCDIVGQAIHVHAAWSQGPSSAELTFYNRSIDAGATWLASATNVSPATADSRWVGICCSGPRVYIGWGASVSNSNSDMYLNSSADSGATFLGQIRVNTSVTAQSTASAEPQICCSGLNVYMAYSSRRDASQSIYFNRSTDGGASVEPAEIRLDASDVGDTRSDFGAHLDCDGSHVFAAWSGFEGTTRTVRAASSINGGLSFETDQVLDQPGLDTSPTPKAACVSGSNRSAVWLDDRNGTAQLWTNGSVQGAAYRAMDTAVSSNLPGGDAVRPEDLDTCCANGVLHAIWVDERSGAERATYNRSVDGGKTWLSADVLVDPSEDAHDRASDTRICCDGQRLYAAWRSDGPDRESQLRVAASADGGLTWAPSTVAATGFPAEPADINDFDICCEGTTVYVAFEARDSTPTGGGERDMYAAASADGGATWLPSVRLDSGPVGAADSRDGQICCRGNTAHVVWWDEVSGTEMIYASRTTDSGATWSTATVLNPEPLLGSQGAFEPRVCCSGSNVYAVWEQEYDAGQDIHMNRSVDGGATWLPASVRLDTGDGAGLVDSRDPMVCCTGTSVHVGWEDERGGHEGVWYSGSGDAGVTWTEPRAVSTTVGSGLVEIRVRRPQILCSEDRVFIAWSTVSETEEELGSASRLATIGGDIPCIRVNGSSDDGATWLAQDVAVSPTDLGSEQIFEDPFRLRACMEGDTVHILWTLEEISSEALGVFINSNK